MNGVTDDWTHEELHDSIVAYKEIQSNPNAVKSHIYRRLALKHPRRTAKAFERRMMNISYVFALAGRDWAGGLKPLKNVGTNRVKEIEELLAEVESRQVDRLTLANAEKYEVSKRKITTPPVGETRPVKTEQLVTSYERSYKVVGWVLNHAKGICELCQSTAPFELFDGSPFLEVHHVKFLADQGSDTVTNAVAVCPNCHKALHFASDRNKRKEKLYAQVKRLIRE